MIDGGSSGSQKNRFGDGEAQKIGRCRLVVYIYSYPEGGRLGGGRVVGGFGGWEGDGVDGARGRWDG